MPPTSSSNASITLQLDSDLVSVATEIVGTTAQAAQDSQLAASGKIAGAVTTGKDLLTQAKGGSNLYDAIKQLLPSLEAFNQIAGAISEVSFVFYPIICR